MQTKCSSVSTALDLRGCCRLVDHRLIDRSGVDSVGQVLPELSLHVCLTTCLGIDGCRDCRD
jgi:hypothetical protein